MGLYRRLRRLSRRIRFATSVMPYENATKQDANKYQVPDPVSGSLDPIHHNNVNVVAIKAMADPSSKNLSSFGWP